MGGIAILACCDGGASRFQNAGGIPTNRNDGGIIGGVRHRQSFVGGCLAEGEVSIAIGFGTNRVESNALAGSHRHIHRDLSRCRTVANLNNK